ncbi:hypothetical protein [Vibrio sp. TBV020]|uniref:hypothetical protein n=1 Tax=Vibrio sp. TBV020 TaxID=3137398 RepID=UPI0038CDADC1
MIKHILFFTLLMSFCVTADDAEVNPLAKKIKSNIEKQISKHEHEGYCDLFIEMSHMEAFAVVKRVTSTGDHKLCKLSKRVVRKGHRYKTNVSEKYIRLHIEN